MSTYFGVLDDMLTAVREIVDPELKAVELGLELMSARLDCPIEGGGDSARCRRRTPCIDAVTRSEKRRRLAICILILCPR